MRIDRFLQWTRPSYQENVVSAYLKTLPKGLYEGLYNPAGRVRLTLRSWVELINR